MASLFLSYDFRTWSERLVAGSPFTRHDIGQSKVGGAHREQNALIASGKRIHWALNIFVGILLLSIGYLSYALLENTFSGSTDIHPFTPAGKPIQIDVLNGCGVSGVASKVTTYLRRRGFDVVEMRNYKSFDIRETLVIDRVGNLTQARQVAQALGVEQSNIIQEINFDYYVEVSVVIGKDFATLQALQ